MRVRVGISGDLAAILAQETILAAAAIRRGVQGAGEQVQGLLREQVAGAGFLGDARGLANAWRLRTYPANGVFTLHPAAFVYTQAATIIDAFEQGGPILAAGGRYLAWPTPLNAVGGRRTSGPAPEQGAARDWSKRAKVTPDDMMAAHKEAAVIPTRRPGLKLWCLRVREGRGQSRRGRYSKSRVRLYVGGKNIEIMTGRLKASERNRAVQKLLDRGYAAMFFLAKQVSERKRLDVAGVFDGAAAILEAEVRAALAQP